MSWESFARADRAELGKTGVLETTDLKCLKAKGKGLSGITREPSLYATFIEQGKIWVKDHKMARSGQGMIYVISSQKAYNTLKRNSVWS
jgi:hypothetical protein